MFLFESPLWKSEKAKKRKNKSRFLMFARLKMEKISTDDYYGVKKRVSVSLAFTKEAASVLMRT